MDAGACACALTARKVPRIACKEEPMANRRLPDPVNPTDPAPVTENTPSRPTRPRKSPPVVMPPRAQLTPEARHALIAEAAYLRAERRGFSPGHETDDWLAAEAEVDALLKVRQSSRQ
jgi:Protein of unknown function (DUF2934)